MSSPADRRCAVCSKLITGGSPQRATCSPECLKIHRRRTTARYRQRIRERRPEPVPEYRCSRCQIVRPASAFDRNAARVTGLQSYCRGCRREYDARTDQQLKRRLRKHIWYLIHYEQEQRRRQRRWLFDPDFRARCIAANRARYHADLAATLARRRELYARGRELEAGAGRRCFCGKALPESRMEPEDERWFCRARCKLRCSRFVCGLDLTLAQRP